MFRMKYALVALAAGLGVSTAALADKMTVEEAAVESVSKEAAADAVCEEDAADASRELVFGDVVQDYLTPLIGGEPCYRDCAVISDESDGWGWCGNDEHVPNPGYADADWWTTERRYVGDCHILTTVYDQDGMLLDLSLEPGGCTCGDPTKLGLYYEAPTLAEIVDACY